MADQQHTEAWKDPKTYAIGAGIGGGGAALEAKLSGALKDVPHGKKLGAFGRLIGTAAAVSAVEPAVVEGLRAKANERKSMNKVAEELRAKAEEIRASNSWEIVKSAAIDSMVAEGMTHEVADVALEGLKAEIYSVDSTSLQFADIFEKSAEVIEEMHAKLLDMEARLNSFEKAANAPSGEIISTLSEKGFDEAEIEALANLPKDILEKVAAKTNSNEQPWDIGRGFGSPQSDTDAFTEFLLS